MRRAAVTLVTLLAGSCAATQAPVPTLTLVEPPRLWVLRADAADDDVFCAEVLFGQSGPASCRTVGEVREFLEALKAE